ncbi:hypothetical protein N185_03175 [Sinorhizobium sp. GW3]|nr:hypothetical protein N185_03175 [Sinorhizobium sp. GW3]
MAHGSADSATALEAVHLCDCCREKSGLAFRIAPDSAGRLVRRAKVAAEL